MSKSLAGSFIFSAKNKRFLTKCRELARGYPGGKMARSCGGYAGFSKIFQEIFSGEVAGRRNICFLQERKYSKTHRHMGVSRFSILILAVVALGAGDVAHAGTNYAVSVQTTNLGWLDQYSLDSATYGYIGPEACVPTVATNALTYLQNSAPAIFGTSLTGSSYADWTAVAATLASANYLDTSSSNGTYLINIPNALTQFVLNDHGFDAVHFSGMFQPGFWDAQTPKPDFITDGVPTWNFIYSALSMNAPVMLSVTYANGNGHEILGSGLNWYDTNGNGIIDFDENARMSFVDPLDPSSYNSKGAPGAKVKITSGHVWFDPSIGGLSLNYNQYQGDLPYDSSDYASYTVEINDALVMAVPEPGVGALLLLAGIAGIAGVRRRLAVRRSRTS